MARHLSSLGDSLVAGIAVDDLLITMQQFGRWGEVVHVGGRGDDRMDQAGVLIDTNMDFHTEVPLVALLGLVHLRIPFPLIVLGGTGRRDQGGIDDRALPHRHAPMAEVSLDGLKDLLPQLVFLQQVAEGQDRGLIWDPVTDQLDAGKTPHGGDLDQGLFHRRVAERVPVLQKMDPQHGGQRIGRPASFFARLGVVGLDQVDQRLPGHHHLHLREKLLPFGLLLRRRQLVIREAKLLAAHCLIPGLRSQSHCPANGLGFPGSPWQGTDNRHELQ